MCRFWMRIEQSGSNAGRALVPPNLDFILKLRAWAGTKQVPNFWVTSKQKKLYTHNIKNLIILSV